MGNKYFMGIERWSVKFVLEVEGKEWLKCKSFKIQGKDKCVLCCFTNPRYETGLHDSRMSIYF